MEINQDKIRHTLLRFHLFDFLEPVSPRLTVTRFMGFTKALPGRGNNYKENKMNLDSHASDRGNKMFSTVKQET